ncbi:MAG: phosphatidylserine decarboxylase family protein [Syntrophaceae bacterium]|nr:phosphatidylserine decarboxylase family protein [Syntrophaceae bacterium]
MIKNNKIPIALEGLKLIIPLAVLTIVLFLLEWIIAGFISLAIALFMLFFFRDPRRVIPQGDDLVVAPADGKVVVVKDVHDNDYLHQDVKQISIFLSVFNVHVNRAPVGGIIESVKYNPGKFHIAALEKASLENEQTAMIIKDGNRKILVKQIAGILARRIICYVQPGHVVKKGERYGLICFGSRADIFLPVNSEIKVKLDDKVKGGKDIIAVLK